jgi:hypothetical protein
MRVVVHHNINPVDLKQIQASSQQALEGGTYYDV